MVKIDSASDQAVSAINLHFLGRLSIEIRSRNPAINTINVAQATFFRYTKVLWEGNGRASGASSYPFSLSFPDDPSLLPSYSDLEKLMKHTGRSRRSIDNGTWSSLRHV